MSSDSSHATFSAERGLDDVYDDALVAEEALVEGVVDHVPTACRETAILGRKTGGALRPTAYTVSGGSLHFVPTTVETGHPHRGARCPARMWLS